MLEYINIYIQLYLNFAASVLSVVIRVYKSFTKIITQARVNQLDALVHAQYTHNSMSE